MDLPARFPSETEVILEDVARFRALSPSERIRAIQGLLADGEFLSAQVAESRVGPSVCRGAGGDRAAKHTGVHRKPFAGAMHSRTIGCPAGSVVDFLKDGGSLGR